MDSKTKPRTLVLCLGNDLMADDAFAFHVAGRLKGIPLDGVEIVAAPVAGFHLLDYVEGAARLLVIDTVLTGAPPGTIRRLSRQNLATPPGGSPHTIGLPEVLTLGSKLGFAVPENVDILVVEAADTTTVGGPMHPEVEAAIPAVVSLACEMLKQSGAISQP